MPSDLPPGSKSQEIQKGADKKTAVLAAQIEEERQKREKERRLAEIKSLMKIIEDLKRRSEINPNEKTLPGIISWREEMLRKLQTEQANEGIIENLKESEKELPRVKEWTESKKNNLN